MRVAENDTVVTEYAEAMNRGAAFPPITVFSDGHEYWLADGFHRLKAALQVGQDSIACELREGSLDDAREFACRANLNHGLQRTCDDKRRAVTEYLKISQNENLSNNEIGKRLAVSHHFVQTIRAGLGLKPSLRAHVGVGGKDKKIGTFQSKEAKSTKNVNPGKTGVVPKGCYVTLYNVSKNSPEQFVSVLRAEFDKSYLDALCQELRRSLTQEKQVL